MANVNFGKLVFGNVDSSAYGIYISGSGAYNAPERAAEFINIPGRNGAFALDQGRYENIEVTYPAGVYGSDPSTFAAKVSAFRNAILSQKGYNRLEDSYNPNEYREGIYVAGVEVETVQMNQGGEFELVFNCKPQRFLKSGETATVLHDGDTVQNSTPFEASPLLTVKGYGELTLNNHTITLENDTVGYVLLAKEQYFNFGQTIFCDLGLLEDSDTIEVRSLSLPFNFSIDTTAIIEYVTFSGLSSPLSGDYAFNSDEKSGFIAIAGINMYVTKTSSFSGTCTAAFTLSNGQTRTVQIDYYIAFDPSASSFVATATLRPVSGIDITPGMGSIRKIEATSTQTLLGNPTYIDCDIGECYKIVDGEYVSLNRYIDLGSRLPSIIPGDSNHVSFDNTFTEVKMFPRWWII